MKRMKSKLCPGLFMGGELLNIDGVTGGWNFMNFWITGYVAGTTTAAYCLEPTRITAEMFQEEL